MAAAGPKSTSPAQVCALPECVQGPIISCTGERLRALSATKFAMVLLKKMSYQPPTWSIATSAVRS